MLILTENGVLDTEPEIRTVWRGQAVRAAEIRGGFVAITAEGRLLVGHRTTPEVFETGLEDSPESILVLQTDPLDVLIGTEPPYLYRWSQAKELVRDGAFADLPCRPGWHTPWGGPAAVRSLASPDGQTVYADIHVGSIMRSLDAGDTWEPVTPTLHEDVHRVAACPSAPRRVYANTARAVYVSDDQGRSWQDRGAGLGHAYGREIAVHPHRPDVLLATVSDGPHGENVHGRLWFSENAGQSWQPAGGEFPDSTPSNIDTYHVTFDASGIAWASVGPTLYRSEDLGRTWRRYWEADSSIRLVHSSTG